MQGLDLCFIDSVADTEVSIYQELREAAFRADESFIADSPKVVDLILKSHIEVKSILATADFYEASAALIAQKSGIKCYVATKEEMSKIVGHKIHHNAMLHGIRPKNSPIEELGSGVLLLDGITSAENVGSIVRSCAAFGVDSLVIAADTPHPFNRRALRVSMGYATHIRTHVHKDIKESIAAFKALGYRVFAAEIAPNATLLADMRVPKRWVLIMGHEGRGISQEILGLCDEVITIEMQADVKSLNVGVAAALLMYRFKML